MRAFIAYLVINHKAELVSILRNSGVNITESVSDKALLTAIYTAIRLSKPFRVSLQQLMTNVAARELNISGDVAAPNSVDMFVKGEKGTASFSNYEGDPTDPNSSNYDPTYDPNHDYGTNYAPENYWGNVGDDATDQSGLSSSASPVAGGSGGGSTYPGYIGVGSISGSGSSGTTKKSFGDTALGGFLGSLFSKQNINKAVGTGIDLIGQKIAAKTTKEQLDAATALEVAKTQAYIQAQQNVKQSSKYILPVFIGSAIVVLGVVAIVVWHKKK